MSIIDSNAITDLTIVPSVQEVSLIRAMLDGMTFASEATLSGSSYPERRCTWATGNNSMWGSNGKTPLENARGFIIDKPSEDEPFPTDYELMDAMDILCAQGKAREVVVERTQGKVASWQILPIASLFVVCEGIPPEGAMKSDPGYRLGVAYAPYRGKDKDGKALTSEVHFYAGIKELMDAGYPGLFQFKFSSHITSRAMACLQAHEYVLRFVNDLRARAGKQQKLPFYGFALPIQCSTNTIEARGKDANGKDVVKPVYYPIPAIPRLTLKDPEAAVEYLSSVAITRDQADVLEDNGRVQAMKEWSIEFSKRLIAGKVVEVDGIVPGMPDDTPPLTDADYPF